MRGKSKRRTWAVWVVPDPLGAGPRVAVEHLTKREAKALARRFKDRPTSYVGAWARNHADAQ